MQIHDKKQFIRKEIAAHKKNTSEEKNIELSQKICAHIVQTEMFQKAGCIALYYSMADEVQTSGLIEEWYEKKKIVLPVISGENIHFHTYSGKENLTNSTLSINEPTSTDVIQPESIDFFIVPGVAFDYAGNRLGRGKGYYDKYLSGISKPIIGICFDFQLIDSIPAEEHDIKMDIIITESVTVSLHRQ